MNRRGPEVVRDMTAFHGAALLFWKTASTDAPLLADVSSVLAVSVFVLLVVVVILGGVVEKRRLRKLASSRCTGRRWLRAFPTSSKEEIRRFDRIVLFSFGIGDTYRLRFPPETKLLDLYRAVEPPFFSPGVDACELEQLAEEVRDKWGVDLDGCWKDDLTFGELFAATQSAVGRSPAADE